MGKYSFIFSLFILILTIPSVVAAGNTDGENGEISFEKLWEVNTVSGISEIVISGDGETIAGGGTGGLFCCDGKGRMLWTKELGLSDNVAVSDNGNRILFGGVSLNLFNHDGNSLFRKNYGYVIRSAEISDNGNILYSATDNQDLVIYNTTDETSVTLDTGYDLDSVAVSRDGGYIVGGTSTGDLIFMDNKGSNLWNRKSHTGKPVIDLEISSKGDFIVYTVDDTLHALSRTGNVRWDKLIPGAKGVALSSDGSYTAVAHENYISIFNRNGDLTAKIQSIKRVNDLSYSDNGEYLAFCTDDTSGLLQMITGGTPGIKGTIGTDYSPENSEGSAISDKSEISGISYESQGKNGILDGKSTIGTEMPDNPKQSGNPAIAITGLFLSLLIAGYISGNRK